MKFSDKVSIPPQVMSRQVGEETVILNLQGGVYYGLDPVGARMWQLLNEGRTLTAVCDTMQEEFEVERSALELDILHLVQDLLDQGLLILS